MEGCNKPVEVSDSGAICAAGAYSQLSFRRGQNKWFHQHGKKVDRREGLGPSQGGGSEDGQKRAEESD